MNLEQTPLFKRNYKKLHTNQQKIVKEEIKRIVADQTIGEEKKQDLAGVFVHKFLMTNQLYLLAYSFDSVTMKLIMLGVLQLPTTKVVGL